MYTYLIILKKINFLNIIVLFIFFVFQAKKSHDLKARYGKHGAMGSRMSLNRSRGSIMAGGGGGGLMGGATGGLMIPTVNDLAVPSSSKDGMEMKGLSGNKKPEGKFHGSRNKVAPAEVPQITIQVSLINTSTRIILSTKSGCFSFKGPPYTGYHTLVRGIPGLWHYV